MGWKHSAITLVLATGFCLSPHARSWADDAVDRFALSPEQLLDATVVSVSKTPEKLMDAPAAVTVLTSDDILRAGATSIPEALRLVPGVEVAQVSANSWAISVRGFAGALADKLLVMVDGREVYDPLFSGVYWDIQDLVLEDIDRVEVIRGPGASLWGANAVNGVINIITKKAGDTQGNLAGITAGTEDHAILEDRYGAAFGDNAYYRVYGKYTDRADLQTPAGADAHDGQEMEHAGFRADWNGAAQNTFTLQGDAYNSADGDLRSLPTFTSPFSQLNLENIDARGANVLGRWNRQLGDDSRFSLQGYIDYARRDQDILGDERTTLDFDGQYELPSWNGNKVIVGGGYRYSYDSLTATPYASFLNEGESTNLLSSFVQDKITLEPKTWFLTLGSKFEHNDFTGFELQPNARLQWHPDETQMVWSSVARAVRTPSRLEHDLTLDEGVLSVGGLPAELKLVPNADFKSERLTAYEMGYRNQLTPTVSLDMTGFYNNYTNLSTLDFLTPHITAPLPFIFPITSTNAMHGDTDGVEMAADWRVLDPWKLSASYSLLQMHLVGPPGTVAVNAAGAAKESPSQQFNIASRWDATKDVSLDTTLYYVAALPAFDVPEYWRLDVRLGWKLFDGLEFSLAAQNLLNGEHREFSSPTDVAAVDIGRSVFGAFTWRY